MITFVLLAAALTVAGVLVVAIPLLRGAGASGAAPAPWAALAATALLVLGSAALYISWSNWPWPSSAPGDAPQSMVARLARELEHDPQNLEGWLMLGNSYVALQEYPLALRAFERADRLSGGKNAEALTGEAETLALTDESELTGRAGRLIEQALLLAPDSGKALFFGGAVAARRGDLPLARQRFAKLLALNPPPDVRPVIEQQISAIDAQLAGGAATAGAKPPAPGSAPPVTTAPAPAAAPQASAAGPATPTVRVNVTLAPSLAGASGTSPLFVFVRDPGHPGPPLAVKRLESRFPQEVGLAASDAMIPGRAFAAGQSVQVVARIARSGNPVGASGDPFGEVNYQVGRDGLVSLVIDHVTP
jgi:cytochrome c-type biogenesis protein CcmH